MKRLILFLFCASLAYGQTTKVGGSGTTKVGGSGTTKVGAVPPPFDIATDPSVVEYLTADTLAYANNTAIGAATGNAWTATVGNNAANGGGATVITGALNGLRIVRFNGTSDYLVTSAFAAQTQPWTLFIVWKNAGQSAAFKTLIQSNTGDDWRVFTSASSDFVSAYCGSSTQTTSLGAPDSNWHIGMFIFNGASSAYRFDGGVKTTFGSSPGASGCSSLCLAFDVNNGIRFGQQDIAAVVIRSGAADSTAETNYFTFLDAKWAVY